MLTRALSRAQLEVLKAARRGEVSREAGISPGADYGWRSSPAGASLTLSAEALMRRGLARESAEVVDGRRALVVTADGLTLLEDLDGRGPSGGA